MNRIIRKPAITFDAWAAAKGIELPPEHTLAEVIGGAFKQNKTKADRGKWRSWITKLAHLQEARAAYEAEVANGTIPTIEEHVPLDMNNKADQAYARVMAKRAARRG